MDISAYQHINIRMSTRGKRPLRNLTPSDKVRAIQRIHNGETKASVSRDIGVPESTLRGWCKNEQKLRFMCRQIGTTEQLSVIPTIENPPEKRPRFENHIQTPKYSSTAGFDDFGCNRLFSSNGNNAILEKIALNEIMRKHILPPDSSAKPLFDNISNQVSSVIEGSVSLSGDYNNKLPMLHNINLLSLLSPNIASLQHFNTTNNRSVNTNKNNSPLRVMDQPKDVIKSNFGNSTTYTNYATTNSISSNSNNDSCTNNTAISVKNWAKDPAEKNPLNFFTIDTGVCTDNTNKKHNSNITNNQSANDTNNNFKEKCRPFPVEASLDAKLPPPHPLGLLQIPNSNILSDSENGNSALLEWCKIFNASLNFLALAAASAALQPNGILNASNGIKNEGNILYKELTKSTNNIDSTTNLSSFINSDLSNDSYFDSEPEDLSVRSTTTSKLSSPSNSRSQSPIKSNDSPSPLHCDG